MDLGAWATEKYSVPVVEGKDDLDIDESAPFAPPSAPPWVRQ